jgi:thioesterase domain-containing protein
MTDALTMANAGLELAIPVAHNMGIRFVEVGPGVAVAEAPIEGNGNHLGTMYAGVLFTVAELLGGALSVSTFDLSEFVPVVKSLTIDFLKPARTDVRASVSLDDDTVEKVKAQAAELGKGEFELVAEVHDSEGTLVARTTGIYQVRRIG